MTILSFKKNFKISNPLAYKIQSSLFLFTIIVMIKFQNIIAAKLLHTRSDQIPIYDSKIRSYLIRQENVQLWWLTSL